MWRATLLLPRYTGDAHRVRRRTLSITTMKNIIGLAVFALMLALPVSTNAQSARELKRLRKEIEALKEAQVATQKQLDEVLRLLRGRTQVQPQRPTPASVSVAGAPVRGNLHAALTIVEFSDYQCPFCGQYSSQTWPQLDAEYIAPGKVSYVFRDFPLEQLHPNAFKAAEAARCAREQGKYWEMHDRLFANQRALGAAQLGAQANALKLDAAAFEQCLASGRQAANVRKDMADGLAAGVSGTPSFFIGVMNEKDGTVKVLRALSGARPYSAFKAAIDEALAQARK
jgi:protein-disulfide isomerase